MRKTLTTRAQNPFNHLFWPYGHERSYHGEHRPEEHPEGHDCLPGVTVAEIPKNWGEDGVTDNESRLQCSALSIADVILALDLGENA